MILTDFEIEALLLSLKVGAWSMALSLPLAVGAAWVLARSKLRGKILFDALVHLPLVLPPVATGYLLLLVMGRQGLVGRFLDDWFGIVLAFRWTGAVLAAMVMAFPLMVRPIRLAIEAVDTNLEQAAQTLGASRLGVFATVTLPLALPGILAGAIMGFAKALGEFGATITFVANIPGQTRTLPLAIHAALQVPGSETASLRLTVIALAVSLVALVASELVARRLFQKPGN